MTQASVLLVLCPQHTSCLRQKKTLLLTVSNNSHELTTSIKDTLGGHSCRTSMSYPSLENARGPCNYHRVTANPHCDTASQTLHHSTLTPGSRTHGAVATTCCISQTQQRKNAFCHPRASRASAIQTSLKNEQELRQGNRLRER